MEQSIRTQPPGPRRRPPNVGSGAAVPGPGRAPERAAAEGPDRTGPRAASGVRDGARPAPGARLRLRLPLGGRSRGERPRGGRPARLTAVGTGVLAVAGTVLAAGVDRLLFGGLGVLFGVAYLVVCFQLAVRVRPADLLAAPISGPIAFAAALLLLGPVSGSGVTAQVVALATGLALRAGWLFSGTGLAAAIVLARFVAQRRIQRGR
ncbi:DUF6542 domain-containing protein [Kitasatospora indigofera]|uniref:DUF6542 domain-containing protein n=1 Tax=Kitasatospora indigofera TaxID=67307 RepID=UPI00369F3BDA